MEIRSAHCQGLSGILEANLLLFLSRRAARAEGKGRFFRSKGSILFAIGLGDVWETNRSRSAEAVPLPHQKDPLFIRNQIRPIVGERKLNFHTPCRRRRRSERPAPIGPGCPSRRRVRQCLPRPSSSSRAHQHVDGSEKKSEGVSVAATAARTAVWIQSHGAFNSSSLRFGVMDFLAPGERTAVVRARARSTHCAATIARVHVRVDPVPPLDSCSVPPAQPPSFLLRNGEEEEGRRRRAGEEGEEEQVVWK